MMTASLVNLMDYFFGGQTQDIIPLMVGLISLQGEAMYVF